MNVLGSSLLLIANGVWLGAILFQTAVVAPTVFASLEEQDARIFLRRLFPRFFRLGLICGIVMLIGLAMTGFDTRPLRLIGLMSVAMLAFEAVSLAMVPSINAARDAGADGKSRFDRLHRINVLLTVVILLLSVTVFVLAASAAPLG